MMRLSRRRLFLQLVFLAAFLAVAFAWYVFDARALNISTFSDTLSDSGPGEYSNHTLRFTLGTDVSPGGYIDFVPPAGFSIDATSTLSATSTFTERNVELLVNGVARTASSTGDATTDEVSITYDSPGLIRYTFNPTTGVSSGDQLQLRIGDHTSGSFNGGDVFSTSTGTTTLPDDVGIKNASATSSHSFTLTINGGDAPAYAKFWVALVEKVDVGPVDTREAIPPFRFNGAPTGNVGGTTLSVEISLETDEFADCKYSTTASTSFAAMTDTFSDTGLVVHSQIISGLTNDQTYTYYVRCIDDEGNFNIDDYPITFTILDVPEGDPNTDGDVEGEGTGSGNEGTGDGSGSGGTTGDSDADSSSSGSSSGGGGGGGSGSGGTGEDGDEDAAGGFESSDGEYPSGDARVVISGYSFPQSEVVVLVDGVIVERGNANGSGSFSVTLDEIARGVYTFGVYAIDDNGTKSSTFSTSFSVQGGRTSALSNVNVMPSIVVNPDPVDVGSTVTFSGFAIPNAEITIQSQNDKSSVSLKTITATSDSSGAWSAELSTSGFSRGTYKVRAKAVQESGNIETNYSGYTYYGVGQSAEVSLTADLNRDGSVNLTDFSILLFWWGTDGGPTDPPADINRDGNVSLTDFSIMLFNWTG